MSNSINSKLATAALEKRAALVAELTTAKPSERADLEAGITQYEDEARAYVAADKHEAEVRALPAGASALTMNGGGTSAVRNAQHVAGEWLGAEIRALTGAVGAGAAFTPSEASKAWFDRMAPASALLSSGVQVIRTTADSLVIPRLLTDAASGFVAEGASIAATDSTADSVTAIPRKIAAITEMSNEVLADSTPALLDVVAGSLLRSCGLRYDLGAYEGSAVAPEIRGMKNVVGIQSVSMGVNGASLVNLDPIADALGLLSEVNTTGGALVMHPRTWKLLSKVKEASGSVRPLLSQAAASPSGKIERTLFGVPVFLTSQISIAETQGTGTACSSIYVYDPAQVFAVLRSDAAVFVDPYRLSDKDMTAVRVTLRGDVVVANPAAVVRVSGILGV